jgi:hypothetical protein
MIRRLSVLCGWLLVFGSPSLAWQQAGKKPRAVKAAPPQPMDPMAAIAESHIKGNVPPPSRFDRYLRRDLTAYFTRSTGKKVTVQYEFLREGPTQTGIAYPKYYLWVKVRSGRKLVDEGAVRVAAIDRQRFAVTHYLPKAEMKKAPEAIDGVFPLPVGDRIRQRLK